MKCCKRHGACLRLGLAALACAAVFASGCSERGKASQARGGRGREVVGVVAGQARTMDVPVEITGFGTVEPFSAVTVKPQVAGVLSKVLFQQGQPVKAGQVLFEIDPRAHEAAVKQAQANVTRNIVQAKRARQEADNFAILLKRGAATPEEAEQSKATAEALAAAVQADQAALETAQLELSYCTIKSPIDGIVGKLSVDQGNTVKSYDVSLVTIHQIQPIYVSFTVPQQYLASIRAAQAAAALEVLAYVPGAPEPQKGSLCFIDNAVDAATGTIRLRGCFENAQELLWPGLYVNVKLVVSVQAGAVVVPAQAVQTGQKSSYVFVVKPDQTVESRNVVTGISVGGWTVVQSGLAGGETVVTDGQLKLDDGSKVKLDSGLSGSESSSSPAGGREKRSNTRLATRPAEALK